MYSTKCQPIDKTHATRASDGLLRFFFNNSKKGISASDMKKSDLVKIFVVENLSIPMIDEYEFDYNEDPKTRAEMIQYLKEQNFREYNFDIYSDDDLIFICKWYLTGIQTDLMTNVLENYLRDENRFTEVQRKSDPRFPKIIQVGPKKITTNESGFPFPDTVSVSLNGLHRESTSTFPQSESTSASESRSSFSQNRFPLPNEINGKPSVKYLNEI